MPIKLVSFEAKLISDSKVLCSWATAYEINNHYFEVERSLDNKNWFAIGKVNGAGNSNKLISYQFTDNSLSTNNNQPTTLYYRLKQTDFDGTSSLSLTKTVQFNDLEQEQIKLYYNQNIPTLQFISNKENEVKLKLLGLSGIVLWQSENSVMQGTNSINIEPKLQS